LPDNYRTGDGIPVLSKSGDVIQEDEKEIISNGFGVPVLISVHK